MQPKDTADTAVQAAYDYFNTALFDEVLPRCSVSFQRGPGPVLGFDSPGIRGGADNRILLHFSFFASVPPHQSMQWLVHEMIHLWQFHYGRPAPDKGHNAEFAAKSISLGLMPSNTGGPGGERLGENVIDFVMRGGRFERAVPRVGAMWDSAFPRHAPKPRART